VYTDTGYYRWTIKATLSNSTVLQCYADYYVVHIPPPASNITTYSYNPGGVNGPTIPAWGTIAAVSGVHSGGTIHIVYSNKNRTNTLRKPLIVVENMDAYNLAPQVQARPFGIGNFIDALNEPRNQYDFNSQLDDVAGYDLVFINFNDGMDGIVRNAAVVQEAINRVNNNKVPDDRSGNITQQNVVLGMGTGGLNARYALANMAKNFSGSNTRLLITHDAPHRGQNIAVGLQYLVKFINKSTAYSYNLGDVFPEHGQTLTYFKSKVCKDVLIYQTSDNDNSVAGNSFINNVYQPMVTFAANAQPYQFIATSLGNECARPLFTAGRRFMDFSSQTATGVKIKAALGFIIGRSHRLGINLFSIPVSELKYQTVVFARSIPNQSDPVRLITAFTYLSKFTLAGGLVTVFKNGVDEVAYAGTSVLPIDGVPGSYHTLMDFTELRTFQSSFGNFDFSYDEYITTLYKIPLKWGLAIKFSLYGFIKSSVYNSEIFNTNYTSLPVGSALDVEPFNQNTFTEKYVNGVNQSYPSKSNNFIAQETVTSQSLYNNASMRFTARNARFLFNEMENLPNTENCSSECFNPYTISGNSSICASGTYFIPGLPRGATVSWSATPLNIVSISTSNNVATVTKIYNGVITLSATITNGCGGNNPASKSIEVGTPIITDINVSYPTDGCYQKGSNIAYQLTFSSPTPISTDYPVMGYYPGQSGGSLTIVTPKMSSGNYGIAIPNTLQYNRISAAGINSCGTGLEVIKVFEYADHCGGGGIDFSEKPNIKASTNTIDKKITRVSIFPNPAKSSIYVTVPSDSINLPTTRITITDISGRSVKQITTVSETNIIPVSTWANGTYLVTITDGKQKIVKKVVKN
jgi:hypothetical protein